MYRMCKVDKGWITEKLVFKYNFLGLHFYKVWRPFVTYYGGDDFWYSPTKELAFMSFQDKIKNEELFGYYPS